MNLCVGGVRQRRKGSWRSANHSTLWLHLPRPYTYEHGGLRASQLMHFHSRMQPSSNTQSSELRPNDMIQQCSERELLEQISLTCLAVTPYDSVPGWLHNVVLATHLPNLCTGMDFGNSVTGTSLHSNIHQSYAMLHKLE